MTRLLLLVLALFAFGCDSGQTPQKQPASAGQAAPEKARPKAPEPAEISRANRVIAFYNSSRDYLANGFHSLPEKLYRNSQKYLETFRLPARPATGARKNNALEPESGLFDETEARALSQGLHDMDRALDNFLGHYADLEKYVADKTIIDDGKKGADLAAKIRSDHASFMKARSTWLDIVEQRARQAEETLLFEHPLRRQILAGRNIFGQMAEASDLVASGSPDRVMLAAVRENVEAEIAIGEKPPFPARPRLERLYRAFLKKAAIYANALGVLVSEGAHPAQAAELRNAANDARMAWNEFAAAVNHE